MRLIWALMILVSFSALGADPDQPAWYKRKQEVQKQKAQEEAQRRNELPVSSKFEDLSAPKPEAPAETNFLFTKEGLTDSFDLRFGKLLQPEVFGGLLTGQFTMGWWWKPNLILSGYIRASTMLADTFLFMMVSVGPSLRYFINSHWMAGVSIGYQFSEGLTRVQTSHIPPPPNPTLLLARQGVTAGVEFAYMLWTKHSLAIGPNLSAYYGTQSERTFSVISLGVSFQAGRPDYNNGDLTRTW